MAFYDKFPYTNFQELNLDWLTQEVSKVRDNRDATDASAAAALASEKAAKASETAAAASQQAAANSETAAAGSEAASADYLAQIGTHTAGAVADWLQENLTPTTPPIDASLTVSGAAADAKAAGDKINKLKEDVEKDVSSLTKSIYDVSIGSVNIADIYGIKTYAGAANIQTTVGWISIAGTGNYDSYYKIVDKETTLYFDDPQPYYVSICVGTDVTQEIVDRNQLKIYCSNMVRYRKAESNLPTKQNPVTIPANGVYVISVTKDTTTTVYGEDAYTVRYNFAEQIEDTLNLKNLNSVKVTYEPDLVKLTGANYEVIFKKITTAQGFQWNITSLSEPDGNNVLPQSTDIIGVIQYDGENNFMGGVHGNESNIDFSLWSEGSQITQSGTYKNVRVWMNSHLYSVNDPSLNAVDRYVEMNFMSSGWKTRNTFKIISPGTVKVAYASGLFGFNKADVNKAVCNLGEIDLLSTARQFYSHDFKQIIVNILNRMTVTFRSNTSELGFVTYRSSSESFKAYFADSNNRDVKAGDYITGECEYIF